MSIEKRIHQEHELSKDNDKHCTYDINSTEKKTVTITIEQQLSFLGDNTGHSTYRSDIETDVPSLAKQHKKSKLSRTVQASQYVNNEFALVNNFSTENIAIGDQNIGICNENQMYVRSNGQCNSDLDNRDFITTSEHVLENDTVVDKGQVVHNVIEIPRNQNSPQIYPVRDKNFYKCDNEESTSCEMPNKSQNFIDITHKIDKDIPKNESEPGLILHSSNNYMNIQTSRSDDSNASASEDVILGCNKNKLGEKSTCCITDPIDIQHETLDKCEEISIHVSPLTFQNANISDDTVESELKSLSYSTSNDQFSFRNGEILKEFIDNNVPGMQDASKNLVELQSNDTGLNSDVGYELKCLLEEMPYVYSKQIKDLLVRKGVRLVVIGENGNSLLCKVTKDENHAQNCPTIVPKDDCFTPISKENSTRSCSASNISDQFFTPLCEESSRSASYLENLHGTMEEMLTFSPESNERVCAGDIYLSPLNHADVISTNKTYDNNNCILVRTEELFPIEPDKRVRI